MKMAKRNTKGKCAVLMILMSALLMAGVLESRSFDGQIPSKEVKAGDVRQQKLMPVGAAVGIHIQTNGLMVLGTADVVSEDGTTASPAENAVREGDYILNVDGEAVKTAGQMVEAIKEKKDEPLQLKVMRDGDIFEVDVKAVKTSGGDYKTGIWVRDDTQGIGTLSFIDENNRFAALGHGIADIDTGKLIDMSAGGLYPSSVYAIVKGKSGEPGEMVGNILYGKRQKFASVRKNTDAGIFGVVDTGSSPYVYDEAKALPVGYKEQMHIGEAYVMCQVKGKIDKFKVKISGIDYNGGTSNKDFIIQITDEALLSQTGGIIQGMSGSPVIQDGCIVGVVTHVFLNDSTKGYGIFIENMLSNIDTISR